MDYLNIETVTLIQDKLPNLVDLKLIFKTVRESRQVYIELMEMVKSDRYEALDFKQIDWEKTEDSLSILTESLDDTFPRTLGSNLHTLKLCIPVSSKLNLNSKDFFMFLKFKPNLRNLGLPKTLIKSCKPYFKDFLECTSDSS